MLTDALEVIMVIIIIFLAIIGLITLLNSEVREPFMEVIFKASDFLKSLIK